MEEVKPPHVYIAPPGVPTLFLAGSIEMGRAVDWQREVVEALADRDGLVLNPRRDDWDASWEQSADFAPFREQVEWELAGLEAATIVAFYFAPDTKAPVTLLELGLNTHKPCVVCCPDGYWRKGNVDIVCRRYGLPQVDTLDQLIAYLHEEFCDGGGAESRALERAERHGEAG